MLIRVMADTHALLWYLYNDSRLSKRAYAEMETAEQAGEQIAIASITMAEIIYLVEKGRIHEMAFQRVISALEQSNPILVEIPFDRSIASAMLKIERAEVPDLPDRIIAATALYLGVPVLSRDHKIAASVVTTVW